MKTQNFMILLVLVFSVMLVISPAFTAEMIAQWRPSGTLKLPNYSYGFLSTTPSGNLLVTTFYSAGLDQPPVNLPALLIKNPTSPNPEVVELCNVSFAPQSGYAGIACDQTGFFYVSGDTRDAETSFLRKFRPDGSPDATFGNNGVVYPGKRCLGVDIIGNYLVMAVAWGEIRIYDSASGKLMHTIEPPEGEAPFIRDIAIDPTSMKIYGVAEGSVKVWSGGNPWEPEKYQYQTLTPKSGEVRSGEGISMDPIQRCAIIAPTPGNTLHFVFGENDIKKVTVPQASSTGHLVDTALSFDGKMLFVTDIVGYSVHVMERRIGTPAPESPTVADMKTPVSTTATPTAPPPDATVTPVTWHRSYTEVVERARRQNKPMVIYFRRKGVQKCEQVENNILLTDTFNYNAQNFICVFEDTAYSTLLAYKMGVFRVPHIIVLDSQGEIVETFTYNINSSNLYSTIQRLN